MKITIWEVVKNKSYQVNHPKSTTTYHFREILCNIFNSSIGYLDWLCSCISKYVFQFTYLITHFYKVTILLNKIGGNNFFLLLQM